MQENRTNSKKFGFSTTDKIYSRQEDSRQTSELYLKEWIHVLNKRKRDLFEKISILEASLKKNLAGIDFTRIYQMCVKSAEHI